jgi:hypothetical protein
MFVVTYAPPYECSPTPTKVFRSELAGSRLLSLLDEET